MRSQRLVVKTTARIQYIIKHGSTWKNMAVKGMENQSFNHSGVHLCTRIQFTTVVRREEAIETQNLRNE